MLKVYIEIIMKFFSKKAILSIFCIYSIFFFAGGVLAPVFAHIKLFDISGKLTATYMFSCHQNPSRSSWILSYPMALCCRCLGFYFGTAVSSLIILIKGWEISFKKFMMLFFVVFADIMLNYLYKINTGNYIRFLTGIIMGFLSTALICFVYRLKRRKNVF